MAVNKRKILESAQKFLQKGALDKALKEYRTLLEVDPRDSGARLKLGDIHLRLGDKDEAVAAYLKVAHQFMKDGFDAKAVALFKQIAKLAPEQIEIHVPLSELYQRLGLASDAMAALQTAVEAFQKAGRKRESLELLRKAAALDPTNTTSRLKIADLLRQQGMTDEALTEYEAVAVELERDGESESLAGVYERVLEMEPERLSAILSLARLRMRAGENEAAVSLAERAVVLRPGSLEVVELHAEALQACGRPDDALEPHWRKVADLYRARGDEARARQILQRFCGSYDLTQNGVGVSGGDLGGGEVLDEIAVAGARLAPDLPVAEPVDSPDDARDAHVPSAPAAAIEAAPPDADLDQLLAEAGVYLRFGKREKAFASLESALARDPAHVGALEKLSGALVHDGDVARAAAALARGLETARERGDDAAARRIEARLVEVDPAAAERLGASDPSLEADVEVLELELDGRHGIEPREAPARVEAPKAASPAPVADEDAPFEFEVDLEIPEGELPAELGSSGAPSDLAEPAASLVLEDDAAPLDSIALEPPDAPPLAAEPPPEAEPLLLELDADPAPSLELDAEPEPGRAAGADVTFALEPDPAPLAMDDGPSDASADTELELSELAAAPAIAEAPEIAPVLDVLPDASALPALPEGGQTAGTAPESLDDPDLAAPVTLEDPDVAATAASRDEAATRTAPPVSPKRILEDLEEADFYTQQGLLDEAEAVYRRILEAAPTNPQALLRLGEIAAARGGDPTEARLEPLGGAPDPEADASAETAVAEAGLGDDLVDWDEDATIAADAAAAPSLDAEAGDALEAVPDAAPGDDAEGLVAEEATLHATGQGAAAEAEREISHFDLAAELSDDLEAPRSEPATEAPGEATEESLEAIFAEFKRGVERTLTAADHETHYDLGIAYREMGLFEDAIAEFRIALESPERKLDCLHLLGLCARDSKRPRDAIAFFQQALSADELPMERRIGIGFDLGIAFEEAGDTAAALEAFDAVHEVSPEFPGLAERLDSLRALGTLAAAPPAPGPEAEAEVFESFDDLIADAEAAFAAGVGPAPPRRGSPGEPDGADAPSASDDETPPDPPPSPRPAPRRRRISFG